MGEQEHAEQLRSGYIKSGRLPGCQGRTLITLLRDLDDKIVWHGTIECGIQTCDIYKSQTVAKSSPWSKQLTNAGAGDETQSMP
jgi:hypothetical protein